MAELIPTRCKQKLGKTLSWPIGAEAVSAGLVDTPHFAQCGLWFSDSPLWPTSAFQQILREDRPYVVFVAEYTPASSPGYGSSRRLEAAGLYNARWQMRINPVLRSRRAVVGGLLRESGLPAVAD